jgi:predicted anti-sigma-YlaC factor YlaD
MRHQPFENWIIDGEPLKPDQVHTLNAHLQACEDCRKLSQNWLGARAHLLSVAHTTPAPGFTQRFTAKLAERRFQQQQIQIRRTLLFLFGGSIASMLALLVYLLLAVSPAGLFVSIFQSVTHTVVWISHFKETYLPLVQSLPVFVPIALWILFTTGMCIFSLMWVFFVWRLSPKGVTNQ